MRYRCGWCKSFLGKNSQHCVGCTKKQKIHSHSGKNVRKPKSETNSSKSNLKRKKESTINKGKKRLTKANTGKVWRIRCMYKYSDGKVMFRDKCGWCNSFMGKDAEQCLACITRNQKRSSIDTSKSFSNKGTYSNTSKSISQRQEAAPNILGINNQKDDKSLKPPTKKNISKQKISKSQTKTKPGVRVVRYTSKSGKRVLTYQCSKCSRFLKSATKKCTVCLEKLKNQLGETLTAGEGRITSVEAKIKSFETEIHNKDDEKKVVKLCSICQRVVKKSDEDYCYVCREKSQYKNMLKALKASTAEKEGSKESDETKTVKLCILCQRTVKKADEDCCYQCRERGEYKGILKAIKANEARKSNEPNSSYIEDGIERESSERKIVKLCNICQRVVKKADEDYCYICRQRSEYKDILKAMKANAAKKDVEPIAGPSTSYVENNFDYLNVGEPNTTNDHMTVCDGNNELFDLSLSRTNENQNDRTVGENVDEDEDDEPSYISLKDLELLTYNYE